VAFLLILPIAYLGAGCLMLARTHIERDAARVFEAVVTAMAAQQAEEASWTDGTAHGTPPRQDPVVDGVGESGDT